MAALKVWDGTAWQVVSQEGPPGTAPVTSVDARTGAVTLSDRYVSATDPFVVNANWTAYTPSFGSTGTGTVGMTPGAGGYIIGAYRMIAPYTLAVRMRFQWGSSGGNGGTGSQAFSLPAGYSSATDTFQYLQDFVYRSSGNYLYLGFAHIAASDTWMWPQAPNAAAVVDVVGAQQPVHTDGAAPHPPSWYPNGSLGIWGVLNVQQRV